MMQKLVNILLVEDDEVDVMNVKRAFSKNNIKNDLYVAGNGVEALEMLRGSNLNVAGYILKPLSFEKFISSVATLKNFWSLCEM